MTEPREPPTSARAGALHDLSEDAFGFGGRELRTVRDVVLRPREVLEAWMTAGPEGGGRYARPLRLYLALNAVLMLMLFLQGGVERMLTDAPGAAAALDPLIAASGKSRDAFLADADNWMSLFAVPLGSLAYALVATPFLRWWDPDTLGWRRGFRATFAWLCAWTVPLMPLAWWSFDRGPMQMVFTAAMVVFSIAAFMRMGAGRWWRSPGAGLGKAVLLAVALHLAGGASFLLVIAIGLAGGRFF